ncbi:MAG: HNH endonuclease [Planctomycetes bacterium]|nr:HNH endonuclease [Planctomycetota bacterium]
MVRVNYRKAAFECYPPICAYCGFGIPEVLEVAHIDGKRSNNSIDNLVILCPTCHKMHDVDLISTETLREIRDREQVVDWSKRMKDAGRKAATTRRFRKETRAAAARKAAKTRRRRAAARKAVETRKKK